MSSVDILSHSETLTNSENDKPDDRGDGAANMYAANVENIRAHAAKSKWYPGGYKRKDMKVQIDDRF